MQACHRVSTDLYVYSIFTDKPNFSYASNLSNGTRFVCLVLLNFLFSKGTFVDMHLHVGTLPMYPEGQSSKTYRVCVIFLTDLFLKITTNYCQKIQTPSNIFMPR